jgi:hypothetical protein
MCTQVSKYKNDKKRTQTTTNVGEDVGIKRNPDTLLVVM